MNPWPELPYDEWSDTAATLHMWTQIVGKIRLVQGPWINHSWGVTLYVTPRGLTTSTMPHGEQTFQIDFDFIDHRLRILSSDGRSRELHLEPRTTADFYAELMNQLGDLDLAVRISARPNEVEPAIPFADDEVHASYDPAAVYRFWRVLVSVDQAFKRFRAGFLGKSSPSHFFWGSFDLAVTRFSGRTAPAHPGGYPNMPLDVMREAYSHELSSAGFWPGNDDLPMPIFYSYAYPTPDGFADAAVQPAAAAWNHDLGEFVLPYDEVRDDADPPAALAAFLESTYQEAAIAANWDSTGFAQTFRRSPRRGP